MKMVKRKVLYHIKMILKMASQSIISKLMVIKIVKKVGKEVSKMDCGYG